MRKTLPQWGRGSNGASAASTTASARSTASGSRRQVKWMPSVASPCWGLSHSASAATVRSSHTSSVSRTAAPAPSSASIAPAACRRGTRYSDWISSPSLGVKLSRKCGRRSDHGPGRPSCAVAWAGSLPMIGWRSVVAGRAPKSASRGGGPPVRLLEPHLVHGRAPAREGADGVGAREDLVEVLEQRVPGQPLEDVLADLVGGLDVEGDPRDRPERAERDDVPLEVRPRRGRRSPARRRR